MPRPSTKPPRHIALFLFASWLSKNAAAMPYHLHDREQQAKDNLYRQIFGTSFHDSPAQINKRELRRSTIAQYTQAQILPRQLPKPQVPPGRNESTTKAGEVTPTWLIAVLSVLALVALAWALHFAYIYLHLRSSNTAKHHKKPPDPESFELTQYQTINHHARQRSSSLSAGHLIPSLSRSFALGNLSKRRKLPPPNLDLEALKPSKGSKRGFWRYLPSIIQTGVDCFTSPYLSGGNGTLGYDGARDDNGDSGSAYDVGAGARLLKDMGLSSAVATAGWNESGGLREDEE
ncbi:MAG: hypothetical protein Q9166_000628 [cf. Caloplaca sp. 2 TL-2023]